HKDPRHPRRALSDEEIRRLCNAAAHNRAYYGIRGEDRCVLYLLAVFTGLRAAELASLTPESFDFQAGVVRCKPAFVKNGKLSTQPLPAWFNKGIEPYVRRHPPGV